MSQYASGLSVRQPVRSIFVATHQSVALFLAAPTSNKQRHGRWNAGATTRKSSRHPDKTADGGMQHGRQSGQLLSCFMISCQAASRWSAAASFKRRGLCHLIRNPLHSRGSRFLKSAVSMYVGIHCVPRRKNGACANQVFRYALETVKSVNALMNFTIRDLM